MPLGDGGLENFSKNFTSLVRIPSERLHTLKKLKSVADDSSHPLFSLWRDLVPRSSHEEDRSLTVVLSYRFLRLWQTNDHFPREGIQAD